MDALKVISLHVRPTFKHPFPQCLVHGLLLPAQLQGQGAESSGCCCPFPQQLLCPQPRQHHPLWGLLCASDLGWPRKICKENEMGPSSPNQHHYLRGEAFCTLLPFAHNKEKKFWKSRAWAAVRYLKSNDKHMEVCPARAHPPVQILGQVTWCLASSFKRALFIYSSQEFGALFFNLPTSFTSSWSACSPRAFLFAINTPSSGWLLH